MYALSRSALQGKTVKLIRKVHRRSALERDPAWDAGSRGLRDPGGMRDAVGDAGSGVGCGMPRGMQDPAWDA